MLCYITYYRIIMLCTLIVIPVSIAIIIIIIIIVMLLLLSLSYHYYYDYDDDYYHCYYYYYYRSQELLRPISLLILSLLRFLASDFPGSSLWT